MSGSTRAPPDDTTLTRWPRATRPLVRSKMPRSTPPTSNEGRSCRTCIGSEEFGDGAADDGVVVQPLGRLPLGQIPLDRLGQIRRRYQPRIALADELAEEPLVLRHRARPPAARHRCDHEDPPAA